jgi:lipoate---protein ligase
MGMVETEPRWVFLDPLHETGVMNMALDAALLAWLATQPPTVVVRSYTWQVPTLSFGVHQPIASCAQALQALSQPPQAVVRRPTGGRAILHGHDVSFAVATNVPVWVGMSLKDSYCWVTQWVKATLEALGVTLSPACEAGARDYVQNALCFKTQTPYDVMDINGVKRAGSAQVRQKHGWLQHGAVFLDESAPLAQWNAAFVAEVARSQGVQAQAVSFRSLAGLAEVLAQKQVLYAAEAESILASCSTTKGSHLEPASD